MFKLMVLITLSFMFGCGSQSSGKKSKDEAICDQKCQLDAELPRVIKTIQNRFNSVTLVFNKPMTDIYGVSWRASNIHIIVRDIDIIWDETRTLATIKFAKDATFDKDTLLRFNLLFIDSALATDGKLNNTTSTFEVDISPPYVKNLEYDVDQKSLKVVFVETFNFVEDGRVVINNVDYTENLEVSEDKTYFVVKNFVQLPNIEEYNHMEIFGMEDKIGNRVPNGPLTYNFLGWKE